MSLSVYVCMSVSIQMKATEQHFPEVLFIMLYKVVLPFTSVNEILQCDYSNENYSLLSSYSMFELFSQFSSSEMVSYMHSSLTLSRSKR